MQRPTALFATVTTDRWLLQATKESSILNIELVCSPFPGLTLHRERALPICISMEHNLGLPLTLLKGGRGHQLRGARNKRALDVFYCYYL